MHGNKPIIKVVISKIKIIIRELKELVRELERRS
jgi:hypothetical protein|tara:strand:- start:125 stop:226 length:102 start_codon:yes stop_codon:yes gene_type:complete